MKLATFPLWFFCCLTASMSANAEIAINSQITIKPGNVDDATEKLLSQTKILQGYFVSKSSDRIELRIPSRAGNTMQKFIEANWTIYQQQYSAADISNNLIKTRSGLKAKEDLLEEYLKILADAQNDKIVKVSTAVTNLVEEIELLRGKINYMQHQSRFANITVLFQIQRDKIHNQTVTSSFQWINETGLRQLLSDFSQ